MNINQYHEKTHGILKLIVDYFNKTKRSYSKEFAAIRIEGYKVLENTCSLSMNAIEKLEVWAKDDIHEDLFDSIYKLDLDDKVFLFKIFKFSEQDYIFAGYILDDSVSVRSFLASFNEMKIQSKYEKILNIL